MSDRTSKTEDTPKSTVFMFFLAAGVLVCFTAFGWAMEKITQTKFGPEEERFTATSFLVLIQCTVNTALAATILVCLYGKNIDFRAGAPVSEWLVVALGYLGAHQFGLWALKYISFPMQVVCKSCKAIPVMFGEMIFAKVQHSAKKKISVFLICAGMMIFTLLGKQKQGKENSYVEMGLGIFLVFCALMCDGVYGPYQNKISATYKPSSFHLMFNMNGWEAIFSLVLCIGTGQLWSGITFIQKYPEVVFPILIYVGAMAAGNIFIYQLQRNFGALVVTTTTTMRKLISVLFSVMWFGHTLAHAQWIGVVVVFLAPQLAGLVLSGVQAVASKPAAKAE